MMPYLRSGVATLMRRVSLEPFAEDVKVDDEPANSAEEPWDPGTGVAPPPPPTTPPCDEAAENCSVDGEATDSVSVASETTETETRPPRTVPSTSWAAKRVRRLLAVQSAFGARFGATKAPSAPTFSDAQTQTLPDASTEEVHCRRCRGVYRRQRVRDDELSQLDAKPRPSLAVAVAHKTDSAGAGGYPEKPASWTSRALEPALVVASEILQYPWGADALILVGIVLLASLLVVLYYAVAVVLPIMVLAVILAMINSALFENSRFLHVLRRLGLT
ncbi:uncharacterized protein LOC119404471 isoform X5 [Rhipicephalus sanguineus]|uniref:Uncharacterized protein n=1 Tax=Rhipicephalus sanguineus TaxID=34632 RepID=A0A9D4SMX6_RHISA|nr:uncharacterized protein LOC119404471 isoform X4 [Rhipicephalus sanguineus]XP_049274845.1 uncharacterized protein LOC119404471 isoform X3 [Rhipicephalus sanguineus]XP_049274847.1 uncharacterized protein LOC119404471 isoform X5 [Rhipicephalus sanguineus]KAH7935913.1 hypothetical protein HPB52_015063 [Rhipicephalus sanguineus]